MPGPEEPQSPPLLDFVLEPMYPKYMPLEDEIIPVEEQPLPAAASPTADSSGYVLESDLEEEPEADDDEDPEEDPADYLANRDDDEEEEEEPSRDDADDEEEDKDEDEEEEEEHPALVDFVPPIHRKTARISIRDEPSISLPPREEVERLLALTTPPPSPLTPLSSPLPQIPSPLLSASPPTSRLGIDLGPRCEVGESSAAAAARPIGGHRADYGIRDAWVDPRDAAEEVALTTLKGVNTRVTELAVVQGQDTQDIYGVIEDTQGRQIQIYQKVETLVDDSQYYYKTARLLDQEALISREAWGRSMEATDRRSQAVTLEMLHADHMRQAEIAALRTFNHTRQEQLMQTLTLMQSLQGQVTALQGHQGPSGGPA
ncbi:hypothetical protein Tco_1235175 [Tanacetum coccineum]